MIGAILYRQIWNKLNLTRKLQDFQQAGKTRHDLAEAIFYMTVARSLMPDSGLAQWNKHNTFLYSGARLQLRHHLRALNELLPHKQELLAYLNRQMEKHFDRTVNTAPCVVTTCRFDARDADTLRTFDSDRNNKDNQVQVTMTILIDQTGIPIDYDLFHGEASEPESLSLFLDQMTTKYGIGQVFVMADRDPNSDTSLQQILDLGPEFVINVQRAEGNPKADENRIDAGSLFDRHGEMRHRLRQTEDVNSFVVVGIRRTAASLHRTLDSAYGTAIRVRARRNLHFGNCSVLSRISERTESRINGHVQILAGVGVLQGACPFGNELKEKALLALAHFTHDPTILHLSGLCGIRRILQSSGEPVVALVNANTVHVLADG